MKAGCKTRKWDDQQGHSGSNTTCLLAVDEGGDLVCVGYSETTDSYYNHTTQGSETTTHENCSTPVDAPHLHSSE
jgi:hypothetical protein